MFSPHRLWKRKTARWTFARTTCLGSRGTWSAALKSSPLRLTPSTNDALSRNAPLQLLARTTAPTQSQVGEHFLNLQKYTAAAVRPSLRNKVVRFTRPQYPSSQIRLSAEWVCLKASVFSLWLMGQFTAACFHRGVRTKTFLLSSVCNCFFQRQWNLF